MSRFAVIERALCILVFLLASPLSQLLVHADISGSYTLSGNKTFSNFTSDTFTIGSSSASTLNLGRHTATFTGTGDFDINSRIIGTGNVVIDMAQSGSTVVYDSANSYTGFTHVKSGTLLLASPQNADNGIVGDLIIGGGPKEAIVTRNTSDNRALIGDNVKVTINQNGRLEFNRSPGWYGDSVEKVGEIVLNGGTLMNASDSWLPTVAMMDKLTLQADSTIDLGSWMSVLADNVGSSVWNPDAILTIKNWSILEPVYMGNITPQQLSQIRFETEHGLVGAGLLWDFVVPSTVVPETSSLLLVPLLGLTALWPEIRRRIGARRLRAVSAQARK